MTAKPGTPQDEISLVRSTFDGLADAQGTIAEADLPTLLEAIGQPQELRDARDVLDYVKRVEFDVAPEGRISWNELEKWLTSARPTRKKTRASSTFRP